LQERGEGKAVGCADQADQHGKLEILMPFRPNYFWQGFASKSRDEIELNKKWLETAHAESRGRIDVKGKLIRETNE